ncbi:MAG: MarR family transcriptional regulator [Acidimicrobiales bacterium]
MEDLTGAVRTLTRLGRLLERCSNDVTLAQYRVLRTVADGGERATQLAQRLAVAKPTITAIVATLVDRGLLRRADVAGDRRAVCLQVTELGREALVRVESAMAERLAGVVAGVDDAAAALAALRDLEQALDASLRSPA